MPEFNFNSIYKPVFSTDKRIIDIWGGRGRGGSHFITDYALFLLSQPKYFRGYLVRQVFNDIKESLFQDLKDRISKNETIIEEEFKLNDSNYSVLHIPTGNKIISKGVAKDGSRTAKMKSLAGATHVFIEEADEVGEDDFVQLDLSLRTTDSEKIQVLRCFNPPSKTHWIWKKYNLTDVDISIDGKVYVYCMAEPKSTSNILSIHSTYHDNIVNIKDSTISSFEELKDSNPERYYNQVRGLISEGAKGRIYSGWHIISEVNYAALDLPKVYAIDFGYSSDPTAVVETKYQNEHRYHKELLYETGLDNIQLAKRLRDLGITPASIIVADPGAGGDLRISELRRGFANIEGYPDLRFNIHPTIKGQGSINFGINKVKSNKNHMTEDSKNLINENANYKWALDANKNPIDRPIETDNHLKDAIRYVELNKGRLY